MSDTEPIRVSSRDGGWLVEYGSYARAWYGTRAEAVAAAKKSAYDAWSVLSIEPESERI